MDYEYFFKQRLDALRAEGRYRVFADLERRCGRFPRAFDHRIGAEVTVWCSNDYLGMGQHPAVLEAMQETIRTVGAGAGGTRNISGNSHVHLLLERELADLHGREAALIFTSGYVANDAALSTLARELPSVAVFSDACNHASMIAGIRNSRAEKYVFRHNDPADLARCLDRVPAGRPKLVCFESVYSMDGDIAPIGELCDVADRFESQAERDRHQERAATVKRRLFEAGLPVMPSASHTVPVMVGDPGLCKAASDELLHRHRIYAQPINFPTVPRGTERLRLTPTPLHSDAQIEALVAGLSHVWTRLTLRHAA
jgi:7-keto-8-aminopelargonate synthetase-like enzyme